MPRKRQSNGSSQAQSAVGDAHARPRQREVMALIVAGRLNQQVGYALGISEITVKNSPLCIPPRWHGVPVPIATLARALRESGTVIHVWTVNDPAYALRLWREGVQGVLGDDPRSILAARKSA